MPWALCGVDGRRQPKETGKHAPINGFGATLVCQGASALLPEGKRRSAAGHVY